MENFNAVATVIDNRDGVTECTTHGCGETLSGARQRAFRRAVEICEERNKYEGTMRFVPLSSHLTERFFGQGHNPLKW